jgi:hypothetical protein
VRAFVAVDPETRRRVGVAWSELDAYTMLKVADAKVDGLAELTQVEVSRTPQRMRQDRQDRQHEERAREERAQLAARLRPPDGYRLRKYRRVVASTARRPLPAAAARALQEITAADGWTTYSAMPYGQDTHPLATRGLIVVAEPINGRGPLLYCAAGRGGGKASTDR